MVLVNHHEHFVLIRGLLREARHWEGFVRNLQHQFPGVNISTPDIPGNGQLHQEVSPKTIEGITEALRQRINISQPLRLIGLSMGGMIAIDWMTRYPHEVKAAVLINTSVRPLSSFYLRLRWTIYSHIFKMVFHSVLQRESDILSLTSNRYQYDNKLLESWQQWQLQSPVSAASARNQFLAAIKFSIKTKPKQPVLIVTSLADRVVDYRCSQKLAQIWQTTCVYHDTAGHDLPLDEPEWLSNIIKQWFNLIMNHQTSGLP